MGGFWLGSFGKGHCRDTAVLRGLNGFGGELGGCGCDQEPFQKSLDSIRLF